MGWAWEGGENQHSHSGAHLQLIYNAERMGGGREQKVKVSSGGRGEQAAPAEKAQKREEGRDNCCQSNSPVREHKRINGTDWRGAMEVE